MPFQRQIIELGVLVAIVLGLLAVVYNHGKKAGAAPLKVQMVQEQARFAQAAASAAEQARADKREEDEKRRLAQEKQDADLQNAQAAAARAADTAERLRGALNIAANTLRHSTGGAEAPAVEVREAGARAAELLGACASRYADVAGRLDRAIIAGQQCEAEYDALKR